jgi:predicted ATP-grasp superfamily ATP-dependent carboligase
MNQKNVLITYGWCRTAYAIMRNLAMHGLSIFVGGPIKNHMCSVSKYCRGTFQYPSPYRYPEQFVQKVIDAANKFETPIYLPVHEETFAIAKHIDLFPSRLTIPITSADNLELCYDKADSMKLLESIGVSTPKTFYPGSEKDLQEVMDIASFPVIIKLRHSNSAKGVQKVNRASELLGAYREMLKKATLPPIVQEFVDGDIYTVDVLYHHGEEVAYFCRKNIREKARAGGAATKCISVYEPHLLNETRKVFSHLKWNGVALCEFKYTPETGKSYLFEINPRYWGTTSFDIDCGVEFPWYQYQIALGQKPQVLKDYPLGKVSLWILGDMIGLVDRFDGWKNLLPHLRQYVKFDVDYYMDLKKDDPRPFLQQAWFYFNKFLATGSRNPVDEGMLG